MYRASSYSSSSSAMAAPHSRSVSATQVGSYFVAQYYRVLQQQASSAHQFYNNASTMVLVDGDFSHTASAILKIHELLTTLGFTGIEIKTINSLDSLEGGILVMVSGSVKAKDFIIPRNFVQSFFLAPQEKGYFVLNDIFQFVDEQRIPHHQEETIQFESKLEPQFNAPGPVPSPVPPVSDYAPEEGARDYEYPIHFEDDTVDKYSLPDQQRIQDPEGETVIEETPAEESFASHHSTFNTVQEPWAVSVDETVGDRHKKTYASILRVSKEQSASSVQPSYIKSSPPTSELHCMLEPAGQQSNSVVSNVRESVEEAAEEGLAEEDEFNSVYVRNLPPTVSVFDIEQDFKNFGRIKPDGVFLRNRKDIGVCYAFVEFEDVLGVQNALQASPIQLAGRQVYIEERRANSTNNFRGGRRGRGRGAYQGEALRGRFVAQGSGRGSYQNDGDYNRSRGNGFYQRTSRQVY